MAGHCWPWLPLAGHGHSLPSIALLVRCLTRNQNRCGGKPVELRSFAIQKVTPRRRANFGHFHPPPPSVRHRVFVWKGVQKPGGGPAGKDSNPTQNPTRPPPTTKQPPPPPTPHMNVDRWAFTPRPVGPTSRFCVEGCAKTWGPAGKISYPTQKPTRPPPRSKQPPPTPHMNVHRCAPTPAHHQATPTPTYAPHEC